MRTRMHDESGMMGKFVVLWVLLLVLVGIAAVDTVSIVFTTFHLSDVSSRAASDAVVEYRSNGHDERGACDVAEATVKRLDEAIKLPKTGFCSIDPASDEVTITVKKTARTVLAGRLSATKPYAQVIESSTASASYL